MCVCTAYVCHNLFALCQIISSCEWNCKYITTHLLEITSASHSCLVLQLWWKTCSPQVLQMIENTRGLILSACVRKPVNLRSSNLRCGSRVLCLPPHLAGETGPSVYFVYWDGFEDWKCQRSFKAESNVLSFLPAQSVSLENIVPVCGDCIGYLAARKRLVGKGVEWPLQNPNFGWNYKGEFPPPPPAVRHRREEKAFSRDRVICLVVCKEGIFMFGLPLVMVIALIRECNQVDGLLVQEFNGCWLFSPVWQQWVWTTSADKK